MLRKLLLTLCLLLPLAAVMGQTVSVSGVVKDVDGSPLPGVSVMEKGTNNGIYTNLDGEFTLMVKDGAMLVFRLEGMRTIEKEESASMDITMEEHAVDLDEQVITAIGIPADQRKIGYSAQVVGGDEVRGAGEVNSISALSGKVAGLQVINSSGAPGSSAFIRIRGSRSLDGNNQPLIIVDGVPMDNSQNVSGNPDDGNNNLLEGVAQSNRGIDINPDDIESITVLKGPNASALYGIAAANGAIVITTKRGKAVSGRAVSVNYNASVGFDQVNRLPELQSMYARGNGGIYQDQNSSFTSRTWGALMDTLYWDGDTDYLWDKNGMIVGQSDPTAQTKVTPYDNAGSFFETGTTWNHNLSFSGGTNAITYRLGIGQTNQNGVIPNSSFDRTSLRFNSDANLSRRLKSFVSLNYTHSGGSRVQQGSNVSGLMLGLLRTPPSFDNSNGNADPANDPSTYLLPDGSQRNYRGGIGYNNPYFTVNKNPFTDDVNRFFGSGGLSYDPFSWLNVMYRLGTDTYTDDRKQVFDIYDCSYDVGRMYKMTHIHRHINSDFFVTAKKDFSPDFGGSVMVGQNMYDEHYSRSYIQGDGFVVPGFYNFANVTDVLTREFTSRYRKAAIFTDIKAQWKNMLFLNLTGRNEWSSTLPVDNRSFFYPSASLGFVFTEPLGWTDQNNILPYGKIRVSYAQVGQDAPVYALGNYYSTSFAGDGWTNGISYPIAGMAGFMSNDQMGSFNLMPEKTSSFEVGADLRFLKGRIGLDATYYSTVSTNQILPVTVAASSGWLTQIMNSGKVTNKGIELVLDATPVKTKAFRWDIQLNFTKNKNMVVELAEGVESLFLGGFEGTSVRNVPGYAYGTIFGLTWLRDDNGNLVIENDTTKNYGYPIASGVEDVIGDPNPDFLMGLRNTLTFKGLSFSFLLDYRKGGDIWNGTKGALVTMGMAKVTENRGDNMVFEGVAGTVDGDGNLISDGQTNSVEVVLDEVWYQGDGGGFGNSAEQFIEDGSFLKLRDISLSYQIPNSILSKTPIGTCSIGVSGRNFLLWAPFDGIDPETNLMGSMNAQGLEYFNMPSTQSYLISLSLGF